MAEVQPPALFVLSSCNRVFTVECRCEQTLGLLKRVFSGLTHAADAGRDDVARKFVVTRSRRGFVISDGTASAEANDLDDVIFQIDKAITIALQRERPDLFFLHSGAVAAAGRAIALPAFPGTGKSTFTLALTESGLEYLSDELAPVNLSNLTVEPYAHALCLKTVPPFPCRLPDGALDVNGRFHVPPTSLPTTTRHQPMPLAAVVFPRRDGTRFQGLRALSPASAATCLMAHLLNGLAHPNYGLDAAISLSAAVPCFELDVTDLVAAVREVSALTAV